MLAYVINLENATKRWNHIEKSFTEAGIEFEKIIAIDGNTVALDRATYAESWYRLLHGRETNPPEIGCYLSHIKALRAFLETKAELALICEDDITVAPGIAAILRHAEQAPQFWNILRLTALSEGRPLRLTQFCEEYFLCANIGRLKGSGAYVVDRKAATILVKKLLPMKLPYDHALDREWFHGLIAASIIPFPITQKQKKFGSSIQTYAKPKLPFLRRCVSTYPYQAFNETMRLICRGFLFLRVKLTKS